MYIIDFFLTQIIFRIIFVVFVTFYLQPSIRFVCYAAKHLVSAPKISWLGSVSFFSKISIKDFSLSENPLGSCIASLDVSLLVFLI